MTFSDPWRSLISHSNRTRQYDKSLEYFRQAVELDANFWYAQYFLGLADEQTGAFAEAATAFQQAERVSDAPEVSSAVGHLYVVAGKRDEALKVFDELKNESKERYVSPYDMALIDAALGDKEQAFADLQKAYDDRTAWIAMYLNIDPRLDSLRSDTRFADLARRIGL